MTTETKIGLIVGLAFILIFAIILSNRGSRSNLAPPAFDLVQIDEPFDTLAPKTDTTGSKAGPAPARIGQPVGGALVADQPQAKPEPAPAPPEPSEAGGEAPERREDNTRPEKRDEQERFVKPPLPKIGEAEPVVAEAVARPSLPVRTTTREYRVKPGDSLSKIARRFYGSDKPGVLRALMEANRDRISSPDRLVAGQKIRVPAIAELVSAEPAPRESPATETASRAKSADRLYVVKRGDTLTSIARRQLGQASRWTEIRDLNRSRLPDPDKLRPGMALRLPPPALASANGRRR